MPRVVPSDVVRAAERMFPHMVREPHSFPSAGPDEVPRLTALAALVDALARELVTLTPDRYAAVLASVAYMRSLGTAFQAGHRAINFNLQGDDYNPVAIVWAAMKTCPDEAPAPPDTSRPI